MEITFLNDEIESLCANGRVAKKKYGVAVAKKLAQRLVELFAVECASELVAGHLHPLSGDRAGQFSMRLDGAYRLVFASTIQPPPTKPDGGIDWNSVTKITILSVEDYHA